MKTSDRPHQSSRPLCIGLYGALLLGGCTISIGITNSPPTPDQCGPDRTMCWQPHGHTAPQARLISPTRNSTTTAPTVDTMKLPSQPPPA